MLRLVIIFVLIIFTVPHIQSQLNVSSTTEETTTQQTFVTDRETTFTADTQQTTLTIPPVSFDSSISSITATSITQESTITSSSDTTDLTDSTVSNFGSTILPVQSSFQTRSDTNESPSVETSQQTSVTPITFITSTDTTQEQPITSPPITTTTTSGKAVPPSPPPPETDWGMILGLSLGIGIPVLLIGIGGFVLYKKKDSGHDKNRYDIPLTSTRGRINSDVFKNPYFF